MGTFGIAIAVAVTFVISVFDLVYAELLNKRYENAVILINSIEKDMINLTKALTAYREDRADLYERVDDLDRELATARAAMEEWKEAGRIAHKSELDFNEGLNNILNFQPGVSKKGDTE